MERLDQLDPPPPGHLPILIGGSGEKVTLRLVAEHADAWNTFGPPENFAAKNRVLDEWCERVGRKPSQIERTVGINASEIGDLAAYLDAGAEHLIVMVGRRSTSRPSNSSSAPPATEEPARRSGGTPFSARRACRRGPRRCGAAAVWRSRA